MKTLNHPNIIKKLSEMVNTKNILFLIREHAEQGNLRTVAM